MTTDTRAALLAEARTTAQAEGYAGLSFRDLAVAVGIKSASVHYHFPTKGDLVAALVRDYRAEAETHLAEVYEATPDAGERLRRYAGLFRTALEHGNRMCLCGILAAEIATLPEAVAAEVAEFARVNVEWLALVLAENRDPDAPRRARAIFAAVSGAQLVARGAGDIRVYDEIFAAYRAAGLIPA